MIGITNALKKSSVGIVETINVTLNTNQQNHSDLIGVEFTLTYGDIEDTFKWNGEVITIEVPAFVNYSLSFNDVTGYLKPEDVSYEAQANNSRSVTFTYKTELVQVSVGTDNGSSVYGAEVTIDDARYIWDGTLIEHKVPFGKSYTISVNDISGYSTPEPKSFTAEQAVREVSFTYIASALKVNILSNQSTDSSWDPTITNVKATVSYNGTSVEVSNGEQINIPSNTEVTIIFPEVEGYLKPEDIVFTHAGGLVEKSGTYQCELLTVNVSADQGSVSGFEVTITKKETVGVATKYTRLEYIEATGTQWIDTGFIPNQDTRVVMRLTCPVTGSTSWAFGSRTNATSNNYGFAASTKDVYTSGYNNEQAYLDASYNTSNVFTLDKNKNVTSINGVIALTQNYAQFTCQFSMYLFTCHSTESVSRGKGKLYSCRIYDNGILVRDYIPALRSDGIAGLYDAVNDTFVASIGSGNFTYSTIEPTIVAKQTSVTGSYKIPFDASYTVSASSVSGYTTPKSITRIASSKSYTIEQKYEVIKVKDLSLFDVYGNPIQRSTANCYVIRETGQYKFPLVYGNAIKNGKVNTAAFTNNGGAYSHDFVHSYGIDSRITTPYIEKEYSYGITTSKINSDVELSSVTNGFSVIEEDDLRYVLFDITNIPNQGANIIVPVGDDIDCTWVWHIWLWPHDLSPVEITNTTGVKYNIMPVNLASKYDDDMVHIKNWFYQWGRPSPMLLPNAWNNTTDHSIGSITKMSKASNLSYGIGNPSTFYYNSSSPYNWFGDKSYYNLWDAACTGTGNSDNDTVKTVYDPCPVGWKVPNGNTFTGFGTNSISSANGINKMRRYSGDTVGVKFPLSGNRDYSNGSLNGVGLFCCVWLSSAYSQDYAYHLYLDSSIASSGSYNRRACGMSIRPVEDDNIQLDVIMISFTINLYGGNGPWAESVQAESGMTWFEWVNSEYNTIGLIFNGVNVLIGNSLIVTVNNIPVRMFDNIIGGDFYYQTDSVEMVTD